MSLRLQFKTKLDTSHKVSTIDMRIRLSFERFEFETAIYLKNSKTKISRRFRKKVINQFELYERL